MLVATALATVAAELVNWWYAPEQGFALAVRTGWALLRSVGFLILIRQVRRGRAVARPLGLILAVTTIFAVGRLVVPRQGTPPPPAVIAFALLTALCVAVVALLYRADGLRDYLVRHPGRLVIDRQGISWRESPPNRPAPTGWLLTARIAAFTYSPLMLVPCLVAFGAVAQGRLAAVPAVLFWLIAGILTSHAVLFCTIFLMRGRRWARDLLSGVTIAVLAINLPLCWYLLGLDGLVRDGVPLLVAAVITLFSLWRAGRRHAAANDGDPQGSAGLA